MNKWRPTDWKNVWRHEVEIPLVSYQAYGEGADAILEVLRKDGEQVNISDGIRLFKGGQSFTLFRTKGINNMGKLVFIPDDEPEKKEVDTTFIARGNASSFIPTGTVIERGYFCPVCGDKRPGNSTPCQSLVNNLFCDRGISY